MEQNLSPAVSWKQRLAAAALGILALGLVFGFATFVSNDFRLIYAAGAILLFSLALWVGAEGKGDWLTVALLCGPLVAVFGYLALPKVPALWPNLLLWVVAAALGIRWLAAEHSRRVLLVSGVGVLFITSLWYCLGYLPEQLPRSRNHFGDGAAPTFALQPVSDGAVPLAPKLGKILVIDFFGTTCGPCIAELPEIAGVRADLKGNDDVEFVLVGSDRGGDTPDRLLAFAQRRHVTLPIAFDAGGKAHAGFGFAAVPALVVLDRAGRVRLSREGYNASETSFRRDLVRFLKTL